jgi:hypothetical protein
MNPTIAVALIGGGALIIVTLLNGFIAKKVAQAAKAAEEAKAKVDTVIHMVDGTQTRILDANTQLVAETKSLAIEVARLVGEIAGRDYTRKQMELRQDKITER